MQEYTIRINEEQRARIICGMRSINRHSLTQEEYEEVVEFIRRLEAVPKDEAPGIVTNIAWSL